MRNIIVTLCTAAIVAATALPALAQAVQTPQGGPNSPPVACGDYKKNADGSWAPTKDVSLIFPDGTTLGVKAGTTFSAAGSYMGLPMSLILNQQCSK
jgi:hypothetical protein